MDIVYVDDKDREIGNGPIGDAYKKGLIVRISRIFITDSKGLILIQKRSPNHISAPGRWDQSAAGHVDSGETYEQAAYRELEEEMGIKDVKLEQLIKFYSEESDEEEYLKKRFNIIYIGTYDGPVNIDNDEVVDYKWVSSNKLSKDMKDNPKEYTEGFIKAFNIYKKAHGYMS